MVEGVKSSFQAFKHKKPSSCLSPKIFQMVKITSWVDGTEWLFKQNLWLFFLPKEDDLVCENGKGIVFFLGVKVQRPRARWEIRTDSLCQWCSPSHPTHPFQVDVIEQQLHLFSSVQLLSRVRLFATPWTAACQVSLFTNSQSLLKLMSIESMMPSNHLILCLPLLLLPSVFPSIKIFSSETPFELPWKTLCHHPTLLLTKAQNINPTPPRQKSRAWLWPVCLFTKSTYSLRLSSVSFCLWNAPPPQRLESEMKILFI